MKTNLQLKRTMTISLLFLLLLYVYYYYYIKGSCNSYCLACGLSPACHFKAAHSDNNLLLYKSCLLLIKKNSLLLSLNLC